MNPKVIPILAGLAVFWVSSVYSDPKPLGHSDSHQAFQQNAKADDDLVHRLVLKSGNRKSGKSRNGTERRCGVQASI
jgi:hypothetical protein